MRKSSIQNQSTPDRIEIGWGLTPGLFHIPETVEGYREVIRFLDSTRERSFDDWVEVMRWYCRHDLFFLLNYVLSDGKKVHSEYKTPLHWHERYLKKCRDVQFVVDNLIPSLDYSARSGGKSTIRTKAASIQMILRNPNVSICIFSVEKALAKRHFTVIMEELEGNSLLKMLFEDILWKDPRDAAKSGETIWSRDDGIRVKRSIIRANSTVEYHAFIGSAPTGSRFDVIHYDDVENEKVVASKEMLEKLHESFNASVALATGVALESPLVMVTNTMYHPQGIVAKKKREYESIFLDSGARNIDGTPGEDIEVSGDAPLGGSPVYPFTNKILSFWFNALSMNKESYGTQFCCSFNAIGDRAFDKSWIGFYSEPRHEIGKNCITYICIDPSRGVVDPTFIWVWGVTRDKKYLWLDGVRKKMDPSDPLFHNEIHRVYDFWASNSIRVAAVLVEQIGPSVWADLIEAQLRSRGVFCRVIPCKMKLLGNSRGVFSQAKRDREWERWAPRLRMGQVLFPRPISSGGHGIPIGDGGGCLVDYFIDHELMMFPKCPHDDGLDAGSLIWEPDFVVQYPGAPEDSIKVAPYRSNKVSWMSAG